MAEEKKPFRKVKKIRSFSFCPEDLPESVYVKSEKNGKIYFNMIIEEFEPDQYGNDMSISLQQSVEERKNKAPKKYFGFLKTLWTNPDTGNSNYKSNHASNNASTMQGNPAPNDNFDDKNLPF